MERKGRVSRAELLAESNRLIRLEASLEDKQKIQEEERRLVAELEKDEN